MFSSAGLRRDQWLSSASLPFSAQAPSPTTMFANLASGASAGPFSSWCRQLRSYCHRRLFHRRRQCRVLTHPGSSRLESGRWIPTISANISVTVPSTTSPNRVEHAGNTGGANGNLDSLDDRLYAAMIRNGRLWTAHNFRVSAAGVANTAAAARNAVRWYEFRISPPPRPWCSRAPFLTTRRLGGSASILDSIGDSHRTDHVVAGFTMAVPRGRDTGLR